MTARKPPSQPASHRGDDASTFTGLMEAAPDTTTTRSSPKQKPPQATLEQQAPQEDTSPFPGVGGLREAYHGLSATHILGLNVSKDVFFGRDRPRDPAKVVKLGVPDPIGREVPDEAVGWATRDAGWVASGKHEEPPKRVDGWWQGFSHVFHDVLLPVPIFFFLFATMGILAVGIRETIRSNYTPSQVQVIDKVLYVDGEPFVVKGVGYHPLWSGEDATAEAPFGDVMHSYPIQNSLMSKSYRDYNRFHLDKIKESFNTIRLYNWLLEKDHLDFLDDCHERGLKVIVTFWMDRQVYGDLEDESARTSLKTNFAHLIRKYRSHPAVLMWALSNEPNLPGSNSFFDILDEFFSVISMLSEVRDEEENPNHGYHPHPIMIPMANVAEAREQIEAFDESPAFEIWGLQPYTTPQRLNSLLLDYKITKPLLISEYGADSLFDGTLGGSAFTDARRFNASSEEDQARDLVSLTQVITKYTSGKSNIRICSRPVCGSNEVSLTSLPLPSFVLVGNYTVEDQGVFNEVTKTTSRNVVEIGEVATTQDEVIAEWYNGSLNDASYNKVIGGCVFEWMDEWWKGRNEFDSAHSNCNLDADDVQSSCGFTLQDYGTDGRLNEEYLGVTAQFVIENKLCLRLKPGIRSLGEVNARTPNSANQDCFATWNNSILRSDEQLKEVARTSPCCVDLPDSPYWGYPLHAQLIVLFSILFLAAVAMAITYFVVTRSREKRLKQAEDAAAAKITDGNESEDDAMSVTTASTSMYSAVTPAELVEQDVLAVTLIKDGKEAQVLNRRGAPNWGSKAPGLGPATIGDNHQRNVEMLKSASTPEEDIKSYAPFMRVRDFLQTTELEGAAWDMSVALSNPVIWTGAKWVERKSKKSIHAAKDTMAWLSFEVPMTPDPKEQEIDVNNKDIVLVEVDGIFEQGKVVSCVDDGESEMYAVKLKNGKQENFSREDMRVALPVRFLKGSDEEIHLVKVDEALAKAAMERAADSDTAAHGPILESRPRYNLDLPFEALVHAIGNAALRIALEHHHDSRAAIDGVDEAITLNSDDFLSCPREVFEAAVESAYLDIVPKECQDANIPIVDTPTNEPTVEGAPEWDGSLSMLTAAFLFLVIQQRIDGLRQSRWLKVVVFQHVASMASTEGTHKRQKVLNSLKDIVDVCQHHLELVKADEVNYADIDDIYKLIWKKDSETRWLISPVYDENGPGGRELSSFNVMLEKVRAGEPLDKTFPERLSWAVPVRLFSFTLHFHLFLFFVVLANQMRFSWSVFYWLLATLEALITVVNRLVDLWMFPFPRFFIRWSILTWLELAGSAWMLIFRSRPDSKKGAPGMLTDSPLSEATPDTGTGLFLLGMLISLLVLRPIANFMWKVNNDHPAFRVLIFRGLTLFAMLLMQIAFAWFFIAPSVATLSLTLCRCPTGVIATFIDISSPEDGTCKSDAQDTLCFFSLCVFFVVTFISLTLMAHVSYMFLSIVCGYIGGLSIKLGTSKAWPDIQLIMKSLVKKGVSRSPLDSGNTTGSVAPDLGIYGTFAPDRAETGVLVHVERCTELAVPPRSAIVVELEVMDEERTTTEALGRNPWFHADFVFDDEFGLHDIEDVKFTVKCGEKVLGAAQVPVHKEDGTRRHYKLQLLESAEAETCNGFLEVSIVAPTRNNTWTDTRLTPQHFAMHHQICLYKNIFFHLYERDLISHGQYEAYCQWDFDMRPPEEALIHLLQFLNGSAGLKALFPEVELRKEGGSHVLHLLQKRNSIFGMRSLTFFVPYYSETVIYTMSELVGSGILVHMADLWGEEWSSFVFRNFFGNKNVEQVLRACLSGTVGELWQKLREEYESRCSKGMQQWGDFVWSYDPPPISPMEDLRVEPMEPHQRYAEYMEQYKTENANEYQAYLRKATYWIERQVRMWASMRGQTLIRNVYGLCEMREAVVDLAYFELKSIQGGGWVADSLRPTQRSSVLDVAGWISRNSMLPRSWEEGVGGTFCTVGEVSYVNFLVFAVQYNQINGARLYKADDDKEALAMSWEDRLSDPAMQSAFVTWCADNGLEEKMKEVLKRMEDPSVVEQLAIQVNSAAAGCAAANALREKAECLVSTKIQLCFGAQVYWANTVVRKATNELLRMDRFRHLELATDSSAKGEFKSTHVCRRSAPISRVNFLECFGEPVSVGSCKVCGASTSVAVCSTTGKRHEPEILPGWREAEKNLFQNTTFVRQSQLKLGEGKAENQNNMITCARGEILNILDMNQDGYYPEGIKLPMITNMWSAFDRHTILGREGVFNSAHSDTYQVMGFREHVFTQSHSAVGRYMALAEFSFVTLIQRFLARPHEVRMHYGHPDMVNGHLMKQTGGVSRGSLGVNVNEDIFLGYEMAENGRKICMNEYMSFGKGREVDFNNASVFLKKLSAGCVMQISSRQVHTLYTKVLSLTEKWALFYGSLAHFINIFFMDLSIFLFTYSLMFFTLAGITPQVLRLNGSPLSDPWFIQIGMFYVLPILVEMNLERSYLKASDFIMSVPFFAHQNRITASFFSYTMQTGSGKYMGTDRGMGNLPRSFVDFFVDHTWTNFIPGFKLIMCVFVYLWASRTCAQCSGNESGVARLWIVTVSAVSYICAPVLYNPKQTFARVWDESRKAAAWVSAEVPSRFSTNHLRLDPASFEQYAKGGGAKSSALVFWAFEWYEYMNSKALNGKGSFLGAVAVLAKEFIVILTKYGTWALVVYFALTLDSGTETKIEHNDLTGEVGTSTSSIPMHEVMPAVAALVVLDALLWVLYYFTRSIMRRLRTSSWTERVPRFLRVTVLPALQLAALVTCFVYSDRGVLTTIAWIFAYMVFLGIFFAGLTEVYLALLQCYITFSMVGNGDKKAYQLVKGDELINGKGDEMLCQRCFAVNSMRKAKCKTCHAPLPQVGVKLGPLRTVWGSVSHSYTLAEGDDQHIVRHTLVHDPQLQAKKTRLKHLLLLCRFNPAILYFQRMFYLIIGVFLVPSLLASAFSSLHTTWLFNDKVSKRK